MLTRHDISEAHDRLTPHIRRTPMLHLGAELPNRVSLKLELLQQSGSFKARGAFNQGDRVNRQGGDSGAR